MEICRVRVAAEVKKIPRSKRKGIFELGVCRGTPRRGRTEFGVEVRANIFLLP